MHFSTVSWNTVHLLANWHSGAKKILKVRQVLGTTNSKVWMLLKRVGLKIALSLYNGTFGDQMTKWGQNYSFPHSAYTMVHLVAHLTWPSGKVGQKLQFFTISMYNGTISNDPIFTIAFPLLYSFCLHLPYTYTYLGVTTLAPHKGPLMTRVIKIAISVWFFKLTIHVQ